MDTPINLAIVRFATSLIHKAFADVSEDEMRLQPTPANHPPVWILGHLITAHAFVPKLLGGELGCPLAYLKWFGPGSDSSKLPDQLPTKEELLTHITKLVERILVMVPNVSEAEWAKPNPTPFFAAELPTLRDIVENLITTHTMLHIGQMTIWRRARDLPKILPIPTR